MPRFNVVLQVKLIVEAEDITEAMEELNYSFLGTGGCKIIDEEITDFDVINVIKETV